MKLKFLNKLADIVVSIDEGKNITDENIVSTTDCGIRKVRRAVIWAVCLIWNWHIALRHR